jgi:hypothetical protein
MTKRNKRFRSGPVRTAGPPVEEVAARAARLGITPERVLQEYARIGFADIRQIVEWEPGEDGLKIKPSAKLLDGEAAAIAEIVAQASTGKVYRIKLHDKTPVLGALGRAIGVFPQNKPGASDDQLTDDDGEDPRDFIIRKLDRLAVERGQGSDDPEPQP